MKRKIVSGIMFALLLTSILTFAFNLQPVKADWTWTETIYIRADGSVDPDTAPISTVDNITYMLTDNIVGDVPEDTSAIVVERDNVVVDGAGYTVQGTGTDLSEGIELRYRSNVTIKNVEVTNFYFGIRLTISSNNTITSNTISNNEGSGISLDVSSGNVLTGNMASNNDMGIYLWDSSNNTLIGNTASSNNRYGIWLRNPNTPGNNVLTDNNASNNNYGIYFESPGNYVLTGNTASNNLYNFGVEGYSLSDFINYVDTSNTVDGKPIYYLVDEADVVIDAQTNAGTVYLINCNNITVEDLILTKNGHGAFFWNTTNSKIENVTASNNMWYGIRLQSSSNNTLTGNTASFNNDDGISLSDSSNNVLTDNTASNNPFYGIILYYHSDNNVLTGNTASNNKDGIYLSYSNNNNLTDNTASLNNDDGIYLHWSSNNNLTGNTASNNLYNFGVSGGSFSDYDHYVDTSNTVDGKPIYYLIGEADVVIDAQTNAGTVYLINCNNITIRDLNLTKNGKGIFLWSTTNSKIENVTASNNEGSGVYLYQSNNNTLSGNTVSSNNKFGIYVGFSSNNTLFHNNFINNTFQAIVTPGYANAWDNGYPSGGNYWSDYAERYPNATEIDDSGVWDTPYVIEDYNQDNYPLMNPYVPLQGDLNGDRAVNIIDVIVLAGSFGSEPDDPNWNPDADMNNDDIVNILDAILIAREFGKTS